MLIGESVERHNRVGGSIFAQPIRQQFVFRKRAPVEIPRLTILDEGGERVIDCDDSGFWFRLVSAFKLAPCSFRRLPISRFGGFSIWLAKEGS